MSVASNVKIHVTLRGDVTLDVTADCAENLEALPQINVINIGQGDFTAIPVPIYPNLVASAGVLILPPAGNTIPWQIKSRPYIADPDNPSPGDVPYGLTAIECHKTNPVFLTFTQTQQILYVVAEQLGLTLTFIWV